MYQKVNKTSHTRLILELQLALHNKYIDLTANLELKSNSDLQIKVQILKEDKITSHKLVSKEINTNERFSVSLSVLEGKWITDDTIQMYFQLLESTVMRSDENVLLLSPVVTQAIKSLNDFAHFLEQLNLQSKKYIIFSHQGYFT